MAKDRDEQATDLRNRPLDTDSVVLIAVGVNADGHHEILGVDVVTSEEGTGLFAFLRSLPARGPPGLELVTSDTHNQPERDRAVLQGA
jgi:putative transposase